jgi:hypothetical protein
MQATAAPRSLNPPKATAVSECLSRPLERPGCTDGPSLRLFLSGRRWLIGPQRSGSRCSKASDVSRSATLPAPLTLAGASTASAQPSEKDRRAASDEAERIFNLRTRETNAPEHTVRRDRCPRATTASKTSTAQRSRPSLKQLETNIVSGNLSEKDAELRMG